MMANIITLTRLFLTFLIQGLRILLIHLSLYYIWQRTGNKWFPLVNARLAFTLNVRTSDNEQNA